MVKLKLIKLQKASWKTIQMFNVKILTHIRFNKVLIHRWHPVSYNALGYFKERNLTQNIQ